MDQQAFALRAMYYGYVRGSGTPRDPKIAAALKALLPDPTDPSKHLTAQQYAAALTAAKAILPAK
jgi:hypothetical protein